MDRFDQITSHFADSTNRRVTLGLLVAVLSGGEVLTFGHNAEAKRKKKKKKKKPTTAPSQNGSPPPPPPVGPVATADASCAGTSTGYLGPRQAQTFRALRSGQLTSASVYLLENVEGVDIDLEIWSVNQANAPSAVLAGTTIANVPATVFPGPRTLTGAFAAPATVVVGLRYVLVVNGQQSFTLEAGANDPCPDGNFYFAPTVNGAFISDPSLDLHFETVVTA